MMFTPEQAISAADGYLRSAGTSIQEVQAVAEARGRLAGLRRALEAAEGQRFVEGRRGLSIEQSQQNIGIGDCVAAIQALIDKEEQK